MKKYEVRFVVYQYNGGHRHHKESFDTLEEAQKFHDSVIEILKNGKTNHFAREYVSDGYLTEVTGIYEVTEVQLTNKPMVAPFSERT